MDLLFVLAQQQPTPAGQERIRAVRGAIRHALERFFDAYPAWVTVPAFVVGLVAATWLFERAALAVLRRMTARTATKVDDALAESLPTLLRPLVVLVALHIVVQQFLRDEAAPSKLSTDGELAAKTLTVVSIFVLSVAVVRVAMRVIDAWVASDIGRLAVGPPIKLCIKVGVVPIAFLAALQAVDYPVASLITALGIGSLAVGLALQDTLKNMFAGIQIVLDRAIRAGDFVEIDKNARGTVMEIGLRSTTLRTIDNSIAIIPNGTIAGAMVVNFDIHDRRYTQMFNVSVAHGADTRRVQEVLEDVVVAARKDLRALGDDRPRALVRGLGDSSIDFVVEVQLRQFTGRAEIVSELYHRFYARLRAEGIEIPFPTRTVYLRDERSSAGPPTEAAAAPKPSPTPSP